MKFYTLQDRPDLKGQIQKVTLDIWAPPLSEALLDDPYWLALETVFPETQLLLLSDSEEIIGIANTLPFYWAETLQDLPEKGWDWLIRQGIEGKKQGIAPNYLGGLQIGISKAFQGQGYSGIIVKKAKAVCQELGLKNLVIPVRPSFKHQFPEESIDQYLLRKKGDYLFDPWLRTHEKSGAHILKTCHPSMTIPKSIENWQKFIPQPIQQSADYVVPGLLNPVFMDLEKAVGVYKEPNVWVYYD